MLILSSKANLQREIGDLKAVESAIKIYLKANKTYDPVFLYYDQKNRCGVKPVKKNAGAIRDFIAEAEAKIGSIDFLLLVGGDKIVPFYRLANPCDDGDEKVLSDNPFASRDDDFLIPERVCARIPDNGDATFIVQQFGKSFNSHKKSFGMSAKIWTKASKNVYSRIGSVKNLKISPPVTSENFNSKWLAGKKFLYFNVHGSDVSSSWYGQDGDEYPIALQPVNIIGASGIVASEACYGAHIINKTDQDAICLKFLKASLVIGFCGSTTIAYGPPTPPSSEADLLVKYFFEYIKHGLTIGECFKNAKIDFARKVLRKNGFLDDDDQKTLLQFVLYGDPLAIMAGEKREELKIRGCEVARRRK